MRVDCGLDRKPLQAGSVIFGSSLCVDFPGGSDGKAFAYNVWETQVQFLGWEDPLEKEMATCSSTLAWKIPWSEEPGRLQSIGLQRVGHD